MAMEMLDSLPSRPLKRGEIERLRAHEAMTQLIELASREHTIRNGGLERAVALAERTVIDLSFEGGAWKQTVLARDADAQHHIEEALKQLEQR